MHYLYDNLNYPFTTAALLSLHSNHKTPWQPSTATILDLLIALQTLPGSLFVHSLHVARSLRKLNVVADNTNLVDAILVQKAIGIKGISREMVQIF